jgi:HSP20 family protein
MHHREWQARWDPFREIQREVGRLLGSLEPINWRAQKPFPALNLYDLEDRYILTAELPGVAAEEIDLSLSGDTLTLRGERKRADGIPDERYRRQERPFGRWSRAVSLPEQVVSADVSAGFANGILTVTLPKSEEGRPRSIAVSSPG